MWKGALTVLSQWRSSISEHDLTNQLIQAILWQNTSPHWAEGLQNTSPPQTHSQRPILWTLSFYHSMTCGTLMMLVVQDKLSVISKCKQNVIIEAVCPKSNSTLSGNMDAQNIRHLGWPISQWHLCRMTAILLLGGWQTAVNNEAMAWAATHFTMYFNFLACFAVLNLFLCANLCWFLQVSKRSAWVIIKR
jgi:hypothetical protein